MGLVDEGMINEKDADPGLDVVADAPRDFARLTSEDSEDVAQSDRDVFVHDNLSTILLTVSAIYSVFAISHLLFVPPPHNQVLALSTFGIVAILFGLFLASRKSLIPVSAAHWTLFGAGCLVLGISTLHFYLLEQTFQATNFALIFMGWGLLVLSVRWLIIFYCLVGVSWGGVLQLHPHDPALITHYSFLLFSAAAIGAVAFATRYRSANMMIRYRQRDLQVQNSLRDALERALEGDKAEKRSHAKDSFITYLSHELRTPLSAIVGFSELIRDETQGPIGNHRYRGYVDDIHNAGLHITEMIDDLHDLALIERNQLNIKLSMFQLVPLVERLMSLMASQADAKNITLRFQCDAEMSRLATDEKRFRQILTNLLTNAIKFTRENGHVYLTASLEADGQMLFSIRDDGIGMSEAEIARATAPFWQATDRDTTKSTEGSGLGLSIASNLAQLLGGRFELLSDKRTGTVAKVWLPPSCRAIDHRNDKSLGF